MLARRLIIFALFGGSLAGALITGRDLFFNLVVLFASVIAISVVWTWISLNWVKLGRHTRALRAQVGRPLEERLLVRNTGSLPKLWLEVRDHSDLPGHAPSKVLTTIGAHQERVWVARTICRERGRFRLGPLTLTSGDPFGLFQVKRAIPQTAHVVIYPHTVDLPEFPLPLGLMPGGEALRRRTHYVTPNAAGVRDYAPGDSINRIHWPSSARRDRLIVKEFELDPLSDIWLFLDGDAQVQVALPKTASAPALNKNSLWPELSEQVIALPPSTEEYGVSVAASLAQYFIRRDRSLGLITYGQAREVVQPDRGERQLTKIMETLAVFRAQSKVRFQEALNLESQRLPRWAALILITASWDTRWVVSAQALKRHGLRMVAVVINPSTFGGAHDNAGLAETLAISGIPAYRVNNGDDLLAALTVGGRGGQIFRG
jgi:uncharacterized protein (DUF58 family)